MKQKLITIFAIVGIISLILKIAIFFTHERIIAIYWDNCKKVKPGMTLQRARTIIGDSEYEHTIQDGKSGEITIYPQADGSVEYVLEYDMVFGSSDNPKIYFDPNTLIVTKVFPGE